MGLQEISGSAAERLAALVSEYEAGQLGASLEFRDLLAEQPAAFLRAAVSILARGAPAPAAEAIARVLLANQLVVSTVCDPALCSLLEAVALCRAAMVAEPSLDTLLARRIGEGGLNADSHHLTRALELLAIISDGTRVMPQLMQLLRSDHARIRSKAVLLIGRIKKDPRWLEPYLTDPDPRLRSNAVEALWGSKTPATLQVFHRAIEDPHHRVAANGCVGLHLAGDPDAVFQLEKMSCATGSMFQAAAAWAMGETRDPSFLSFLREMTRSAEPNVRRSAIRAMASVRKGIQNQE